MKNLVKIGFFLLLITVAMPSNSMNVLNNTTASPNAMSESEASRLANRLNEIETMDKSNLSRPEKRELRREVRAIKKTADSSGGVYLSVGAVILIIVLLIILL